MKRLRIFGFVFVVLLVTTSNAWAVPTLHEIVGSAAGYPDASASGQNYVSLTSNSSSSLAMLILESTTPIFANENVFGIYDPYLGTQLDLFIGTDVAVTSVTVEFDLSANTATNTSTGETANIGSVFGFYLIVPENRGTIYYTDESMSPDNTSGITYEHGLIYDTSVETINGLEASVVVAFDDQLYPDADWDYNDMVVSVSNVTPIPAPGRSVSWHRGYDSKIATEKTNTLMGLQIGGSK